jgi:Uma2 family endonuclease
MKALMPVILPAVAAGRKSTGADKWDEMWDGVLHMPPMPNRYHQDLEWELHTYLRQVWASRCGWRVHHGINVASPGNWPNDYRIPDIVLLSPERFSIDRIEYFEGGPNVAIEIHSPGDEAYEKLEFYAAVNVQEVWIIDRDTRVPEVYLSRDKSYERLKLSATGWLESPATGIEMKAGDANKLDIRIRGEEATMRHLPEQ